MNETASETRSNLVPMTWRELARIGAIGAVIGALSVGLYVLFHTYIFQAVLCRDQANTACGQAATYAAITTAFIASFVAVVVLAHIRVYRPLLIILAAILALWGIQSIVAVLPWYWALAGMIAVGALAYSLFAWIARIRSFILSAVAAIVIAVIIRCIIVL
ncbi:hypothetical protein HG436_004100 [Candidatus Saccharibacteria bacterium]|jgi:membrane protein|nr:hypothetical protein [Candidatus Saccharibacteria bacterium]QUB37863.1 hypothetical protein J5A52_02115 [TM7 phylum sp. oral taxon 349]